MSELYMATCVPWLLKRNEATLRMGSRTFALDLDSMVWSSTYMLETWINETKYISLTWAEGGVVLHTLNSMGVLVFVRAWSCDAGFAFVGKQAFETLEALGGLDIMSLGM